MKSAGRYELVRWLSLDVALGALAGGGMVAKLLGMRPPLVWWIALPLSVWVMYTADHLLDAWRLKGAANTDRHMFHYQYFKPIAIVWLVAFLCCSCVLPWWMPEELIYFGLSMGGVVLLHLGMVWWVGDRVSWFFQKEIGVGLIYSLGVWGGPVVLSQEVQALEVGIGFMQFFLLAMMNLWAFSMYEIETDEQDGHTSFARAVGVLAIQRLIGGVGVVVLVLGIAGLSWAGNPGFWKIQLVYALMLITLASIAFYPNRFRPNDAYRIWGDGAFIFPFIMWLL
ncbi:MAG: hypothetical protein AAGI38_16300 [Bacteroidota bacterium]